eukprot:TRINITY_DN72286_c0_g1_i1.p1 TRINITY_DN72286_c0_g1~~TRINITY_DN72286_c0_g1_i1.p1  ORF type:complete len:574 (-),score=104.06 TRINITY_DN72286_c0_g1_i1:168-1889(-)
MAPILSKPTRRLPPSAEEAQRLASRRAGPVAECMSELWKVLQEASAVVVEDLEPYVYRLGKVVDRLVSSSARFLQAHSCVPLDPRKTFKGSRKTSPLSSSLPPLFILFLLGLLYNAYVFGYMPAVGMALNSKASMIFHSFFFLVLASFYKVAATDPGTIPQTEEWRTFGSPPEVLRERKRGSNEARWCRKSESYKPDRAHYCRFTKRGVLRMDHHCPWLGNTVGFRNHKFFFLFLAYASAACSQVGLSLLQLLVAGAKLPPLTAFLCVGAEGLTGILISILTPFFLFHLWMLCRNLTTIEFCDKMRKNEDLAGESAYDTGVYENLCSVLGNNPLLWFMPVGGPSGDGLSFAVPPLEPPPRSTQRDKAASAAFCFEGDVEKVDLSTLGSTQGSPEDSDPEATHPAVDQMSEEAKSEAFGSDADFHYQAGLTDSGDEEAGQGPGCIGRALDNADCIAAWTESPEEFREDLQIGCEAIGESFEESIIRFVECCVPGGRRPQWNLGRRLANLVGGPAQMELPLQSVKKHRRSLGVRIAPQHCSDASDAASTGSSRRSHLSQQEACAFLSGEEEGAAW